MVKKVILLITVLLTLCGCRQQTLNLPPDTEPLKTELTLAERQALLNQKLAKELEGGSLTAPKIVINPYGNAPLTALLQFETAKETAVELTVKGRTKAADLLFHFPPTKNHLLPIIGLLSDKATDIIIKTDRETQKLQIKGDTLPDDTFLAEVTKPAAFSEQNKLYFTSPSAKGHVAAYDLNGDLRWILSSMNFWDVNLTKDGYLLLSSDRLLNSPYYTTGFVMMDLLGHILREYSLPGGYHHDIDELPNGNFLVCTDDFKRSSVEDVVVEVERESGKIVRKFDLATILPIEEGKSLNWTRHDWFHNNAVDYEPVNGTLTVSGRHQDIMAVINYKDAKLLYLIGDPNGWSASYQNYFLKPLGNDFEWQWAQHAATWLDAKHLMVFDNGMNRAKTQEKALKAEDNYSRLVVYEIDFNHKTIKQVYEYGKERGYAYYSPYISDADCLGENHYLATSGGISYLKGKINNEPGSLTPHDEMNAFVSEIKDKRLIFEMKFLTNIYRAEKIDITKAVEKFRPFASLTFGGNLGESKYLKLTEADLLSNFDRNVERLNPLPCHLTLEHDRLTVTASLAKNEELELLLMNEQEIRRYPLHTDSTPGMCVAVFNTPDSDKSLLIQTISLLGLKGEYRLLYIYNGALYDSAYTFKVK